MSKTPKHRDPRVDPDMVRRPVMAVGHHIIAGARGMEVADHSHRKAQLLYLTRGMLRCEVQHGLWLVPPHSAVWIPGGARHRVKAVGTIAVTMLFVEPAAAPSMPPTCCTVAVSPLLRELLLRCTAYPAPYPAKGPEARLAAVLLDELAAAPIEQLHLPLPGDGPLRRISDGLAKEPADRATVAEWAGRIGVSARTLSRLVLHATGMSFGRWRQQLHIILALQWLARGATVQRVANDLGYGNASSFVVMFRKALGASPGRYMAERAARSVAVAHAGRSAAD